jgi:hypothetical protein
MWQKQNQEHINRTYGTENIIQIISTTHIFVPNGTSVIAKDIAKARIAVSTTKISYKIMIPIT